MMQHLIAAFTLVILSSAGCTPLVALPATNLGDRENLTSEIAQFLSSADTTRTDVLMRLGEPDVAALDGSWFLYRTRQGLDRTLWLLLTRFGPLGTIQSQDFQYFRMVIFFDPLGTTERVAAEGSTCTFVGRGMGPENRIDKCLNIEGTDLPLMRGLR